METLNNPPIASDNDPNDESSSSSHCEAIMRAFHQLRDDKKDEFIQVYIEMCRKSPLCYVAPEQHVEVFEKIGMPMNGQVAGTLREEESLKYNEPQEESIEAVDQPMDEEDALRQDDEAEVELLPTEAIETIETTEFEFKIPDKPLRPTVQMKASSLSDAVVVDNVVNVKQETEQRGIMQSPASSFVNCRSRRCTTFYERTPPLKMAKIAEHTDDTKKSD